MPDTIHATCVVIGCQGVLIRGATGSGKSALALALMSHPRAGYSALISDDRTAIAKINGRVIASGPDTIRGLIEIRGIGPAPITPVLSETLVFSVVDLLPADDVDRVPQPGDDHTQLAGATLRRLCLPAGAEHIAPNTHAVMQVLIPAHAG